MAITTGVCRFSYAHVWEPRTPENGGEPKYSLTLLIPKSDTATYQSIVAAINEAKQLGVSSKWGGVMPAQVRVPLYDGDGVRPNGEAFGEECRGHWVMTASSKTKPGVVDANVQPILERAEVYSGCFGRVNINFFAYNNSGNRGIGCALNHVQKTADGEPLGGSVSVNDAFGGSNAFSGFNPVPGGVDPITGLPF